MKIEMNKILVAYLLLCPCTNINNPYLIETGEAIKKIINEIKTESNEKI